MRRVGHPRYPFIFGAVQAGGDARLVVERHAGGYVDCNRVLQLGLAAVWRGAAVHFA
jgi:hypothetical protein